MRFLVDECTGTSVVTIAFLKRRLAEAKSASSLDSAG